MFTAFSVTLSRVENLLGKSVEQVKCHELLELLKNTTESPYIELKGYGASMENWDKIRETVLKATVGFLNSAEGEGLLVLGYDEKRREPTPVSSDALRLDYKASARELENKIRDTIISAVKSIPRLPFQTLPLLKIKAWRSEECGLRPGGFIAVVHIVRTFDALYYFDDRKAYIREGSRTRQLTLEEILRVIEAKSRPIVVLLATQPIPQPDGSVRIVFVLRNIGSTPASSIVAVVEIPKDPWMPLSTGGHILKDSSDVLTLQYSSTVPFSAPLFPHVNSYVRLWVSVRGDVKPHKISFRVVIHTESTRSLENLELEFGEVCSELIELEVLDYRTMSTIYRGSWREQCPEPLQK